MAFINLYPYLQLSLVILICFNAKELHDFFKIILRDKVRAFKISVRVKRCFAKSFPILC